MTSMDERPRALDGIRVLDIAGNLGNYCGKLFADLGADIVLVEPPCGARTRREAPFLDAAPGAGRSFTFAYENTSKRGITLNLDSEEGQSLFRRLAADADLVIESEKPGVMAARGLDAAALRAGNPRLVVTSITPFGQSGPYADYEAEDIVAMALGGMMSLAGYPDAAPLATAGFQAVAAANLFAAVASLMAVMRAEETGEGEAIDVSMQECVVMGLENAAQFHALEGTVRKRYAGDQRQAGAGVFPCKDGDIYLLAGGIAANRFWKTTIEWLLAHEVPGAEELTHERWLDLAFLRTEEAKTRFREIFTPFAMARTKAELYADGQRYRVPLCPVSTPRDVLENRQLRHRGYFVPVPRAGRDIVMPGEPYKLARTPWRLSCPAPTLGEHNGDVYVALGLGQADLSALAREGVI